MNWSAWGMQTLQVLVALAIAPLFAAWLQMLRALLQNRRPAGLLQGYRDLRRLFHKEAFLPEDSSWLFRFSPYVLFGTKVMASTLVPILAVDLPLAPAADVIALVGLLAVARIFQVLAAMDTGTPFASLGAHREMLVSALAEPALLSAFFIASLLAGSTSLSTIVLHAQEGLLSLHPSMVFAAAAFFLVLLVENSRIPVDNPATHLELTMIHEAMLLEYSGRHLALLEWGAQLKLLIYVTIGIALFFPWGIADEFAPTAILLASLALLIKLFVAAPILALVETLLAKKRLFRVPEFATTAFLFGVIGLLTHFMLGS
ncbi:formate hydrogenlyase [Acidithiobacillus sp. CV18-2]|nr:formate hydrogenlyase [Acidithiobacillus sp. CV18-3]MBU2756127.1 formate hydrogenlyase [Acidithiobacillus sp. BN09-2]MBU2777868.1 formate hydrogenlyase [Acidithiobacillus sp. CV18-2]MBU2798063.1 formate hydrogenlyase [Acidithiobacillus sp. VAN18-4]UTV82092.1 NADH-quinone oxidoreductase subunit H [Acidithiobacillus sp. YTS05]